MPNGRQVTEHTPARVVYHGGLTAQNFNACFSVFLPGRNGLFDLENSQEKNNRYYEVQRSENGHLFELVSVVNTKEPGGTIQSPLSYETVASPPPGNSTYYQLKQVDPDNSFSHSELVFP